LQNIMPWTWLLCLSRKPQGRLFRCKVVIWITSSVLIMHFPEI
jgi:hypothetical protein